MTQLTQAFFSFKKSYIFPLTLFPINTFSPEEPLTSGPPGMLALLALLALSLHSMHTILMFILLCLVFWDVNGWMWNSLASWTPFQVGFRDEVEV